MFDRLLCKWIHKKDITIGDIAKKLEYRVAQCIMAVIVIGFLSQMIVDPVFRRGCIIFIVLTCAIIGLIVALIFWDVIIAKVASIKVASCPLEPNKKE